MPPSRAAALLILVAAPAIAAGDVYRYTGPDGTACFTDAPVDTGAVLIMKERRTVKGAGKPSGKARPAPDAGAAAARPEPTGPAGEAGRLPVTGRISSVVGLRHDPIDGKLRFHNGVDIAVPEGTEVRPVAPGRIVFSGTRSGYGNVVIVAHPDGMLTLYAHNSQNMVTEAQLVDATTVIARSGSTGRSTGPHLHFEAWSGKENVTSRYVTGLAGGAEIHEHSLPSRDRIRTVLREDGSLLFTNLN